MTGTKIVLAVVMCGKLAEAVCRSGFSQSSLRRVTTTVCEISVDPTRFNGKTVAVRGQFESDGIERSGISDPACGEVGLGVYSPKHFVGESNLMKALDVGHPGTLDKIITGVFIGRFEWHPDQHPKRVLVLTEVRHISVVKK